SVSEADVRTMLGTIERSHVIEILRALADADAVALLAVVEQLSQQAPDYEGLLAELLTDLQQIAIAQVSAEAVDAHIEARDTLLELAQRMDPEDVQLYYQIGLIGRRDLPLSPDPRGGMEMILLRMLAFRPTTADQTETVARPVKLRPAATTPATNRASAPSASPTPAKAPVPSSAASVSEDSDWSSLVEGMRLKGMVRELAMNCTLEQQAGEQWQLTLDGEHQQLLNKTRQQQLEDKLAECLGKNLKLKIEIRGAASDTPARQRQREIDQRHAGAVEAITSDPNVKAFQKAFGATLHDETICPRDS
ncbi:DNA polymerase III subunits gamma and tau, partial [hydrothermal vent metagenome]